MVDKKRTQNALKFLNTNNSNGTNGASGKPWDGGFIREIGAIRGF